MERGSKNCPANHRSSSPFLRARTSYVSYLRHNEERPWYTIEESEYVNRTNKSIED